MITKGTRVVVVDARLATEQMFANVKNGQTGVITSVRKNSSFGSLVALNLDTDKNGDTSPWYVPIKALAKADSKEVSNV